MRWFPVGQWTAESVEAAARAIGAQFFLDEWDELLPHQRAKCRRTASRALGAAIVAVQRDERPVRRGFVTVADG